MYFIIVDTDSIFGINEVQKSRIKRVWNRSGWARSPPNNSPRPIRNRMDLTVSCTLPGRQKLLIVKKRSPSSNSFEFLFDLRFKKMNSDKITNEFEEI